MTLAPTPSSTLPTLQPAYFTSSLYVEPLRNDITSLVHAFHDEYSKGTSDRACFEVFKTLWRAQGWPWLHFKVLDNRSRETFLNVTLRLFLERTVITEAPFTRATCLFALYTFFNTQLRGDIAPPLLSVSHIRIPVDHYASLMEMPKVLNSTMLLPLQPIVASITQSLNNEKVFYILPNSSLYPMNPRTLPREVVVEPGTVPPSELIRKGPGRPSNRDRYMKSQVAIDGLSSWLMDSESKTETGKHKLLDEQPEATMSSYQKEKQDAIADIMAHKDGEITIERANEHVLERLRQARELADSEVEKSGVGIQRVERAVEELKERKGVGLLGLVQ